MKFELTENQAMIRDMVRDYANSALAGRAEEIDQSARFPADSISELAEMGIMGITVPEKYGGAGLDTVARNLAIAEIARVCAATAEIVAVHSAVNDALVRWGNEEQKAKYLPMACSGKLGAFALTEPGAGSDAASAKTKAVIDGDDYVINGTKCFISNTGPEEGDYVVVFALTDPSKGVKGLSGIIVDRGTPGFSIGKTENKMGIRGAGVSELIFEDCRIPRTQLLGKEGEGFKIAMTTLDGGRTAMAAQAVGLAKGAIEQAVKYSKQRVQFGKPISANQGLQWYLADMATRTEAARLLMLQASEMYDRGVPMTKEAAMAKYFASENAVWVTNKALQIHGGYGYMKDYAIERMYRDARIIPLYEGTSEVQKMVISRELLK